MSRQPPREHRKVLCRNKKARHEYHLEEPLEAGIALVGSEVKSLREGRATLTDAYAEVRNSELWLVGLQIAEYPFAHARNHDPRRVRKLLMHKQEIRRLDARSREKGMTLIPTELYLKGGRVKVEIALARGKQAWDKREATRKRDQQRELEAELGRRR
ncbi:MAG TPA: SsrA-binding protein SmpB [Polyangia bacterium]|nr:SsrA-binding protein SmpB [Polyangia bacterium]